MEATVRLPDGVPVAEALIRTYIVVLATEPVTGVILAELPKPELDEVETSKPVGAVTRTGAVKLEPEIVKLCAAETAPVQAVNPVNGPVATIKGMPHALIVTADDAAETQVVVVFVKVNVAVPGDIPVTVPPFVTVATVGLLLDHVPPVVGDKVVVALTHIELYELIKEIKK